MLAAGGERHGDQDLGSRSAETDYEWCSCCRILLFGSATAVKIALCAAFEAPDGTEIKTLSKTGVGARLRRKEDDRFLHGRGQYVADIRFPRMREVAFVRSPVAHARLTGIRIPEHLRSSVFTAKDLTGVQPIRAVSPLPGFQVSEQPPLVTDKIRHVGELIAMCVADTRAEAEDIAAAGRRRIRRTAGGRRHAQGAGAGQRAGARYDQAKRLPRSRVRRSRSKRWRRPRP